MKNRNLGLSALVLVLAVFFISACSSSSGTTSQGSSSASTPTQAVSNVPVSTPTLAQPTIVSSPVLSVATLTPVPPSPSPTKPAATATSVPTFSAPKASIEISLFTQVPDFAKGKIGVNVVSGRYQIKGDTTLLEGSQMYFYESDLLFPAGLGITVGKGGVSLKGTQYPEGTKLIVDASGNLTKIN